MTRISLKEAYDNRDVIAWLVKHQDEIDEMMNILKNINPDGDLTNIVLNKGVYIINAVASFSANGSGLRQLYLSYASAGSLINRFAVSQNSPTSSGSATRISLTTILEITADNTAVYLVGLQTSGSSLTVDGIGMQAARLK